VTTTDIYCVFAICLNRSLSYWCTSSSRPRTELHFCSRTSSDRRCTPIDRDFAWFVCEPLQVGGMADHVHILSGLSRTTSLAELVKKIKTSSTTAIKAKGHTHFSWQSGYGAFSVSQSARESVIEYIANQEIHHRKMTFQEEFRTIVKKHGVSFDERYVWD